MSEQPRDAYQYSFRFTIDPFFRPEHDLRALEAFVRAARIDDVSLFMAPQDLNTGHLPPDEMAPWLALFEQAKARLAALGVTLSINQWYTLMHEDLGQPLRPDQPFQTMVDAQGRACESCVCPADEAWQDFFCESFACLATLDPHIHWVEDDFRYHNHQPLQWGGCFCEKHMALYAERAGVPLTREAFVRGVLAPGGVHPYRSIWLDCCADVQEQVARRLSAAVHRVSPGTRLGLMSSAPYMHAAEGRRWHPLLEAFAGPNPPVDRIHLPGYVEPTGKAYLQNLNMVSMQTRHFLPPATEVYPELENYPYSPFTKSRRFTRFQLLTSLPLNPRGIAMNLFDLNGNGIVWTEGMQDTLAETKDYLGEMMDTGIFGLPAQGVKVLCSERAAHALHTGEDASLYDLCPQEIFFAGLLPAMGIPFAYTSDPAIAGEIVAASGQSLRNLTPDALEALFARNFLLLNGDAVDTLCRMGLGHLAGVRGVRWMRMNGGAYSYEQTAGTEEAARASAIIFCSDATIVDYDDGAQALSRFCNARRETVCPATTLTAKHAAVFPFGHFEGPLHIPPMLLNPVRQRLLQAVVAQAMAAGFGGAFPCLAGTAHVHPYAYRAGSTQHLYLANGSGDDLQGLAMRAPTPPAGPVRASLSNGVRSSLPAAWAGGRLTLTFDLPALETVHLSWSTSG